MAISENVYKFLIIMFYNVYIKVSCINYDILKHFLTLVGAKPLVIFSKS